MPVLVLLFCSASGVPAGADKIPSLPPVKAGQLVWIPAEHCNQQTFAATIKALPGVLAIPPGHTVRRERLRSFFDLPPHDNDRRAAHVVIVDWDGSVISTDAAELLSIVHDYNTAIITTSLQVTSPYNLGAIWAQSRHDFGIL